MNTWSKTPPTEEDIKRSYNGYFWVRFTIMEASVDEEGVWPEIKLIQPVQVTYLYAEGELSASLLELDHHEKAVIRLGDGTPLLHLDNPVDMKDIEWQDMISPNDVSENDC